MKYLLVAKFSEVEPLGIMYLGSALKNANHKVDYYLYKGASLNNLMTDFEDYIKNTKPDIVGFSTYTGNHLTVYSLCGIVKKYGIISAIGGHHATYFADECAKYADYVFRGESLLDFPQLKVPIPPFNLLSPELIPLPDRDGFYSKSEFHRNNRIKNIFTSFGCPYSCSYCISADTLILMSDLNSKKIKDIKIGDKIIGFDEYPSNKRKRYFKESIVEKIYKVKKKAIKIILEDNREIICSADHKWLTKRGWKYTFPSIHGRQYQRKYLTLNNSIREIGEIIENPNETTNYKLGYLSGIIKGDGTIGIYDYSKQKRDYKGINYSFRLALKDKEAIRKTQKYLKDFGIEVNNFLFGNELYAIRCNGKEKITKLKKIIRLKFSKEFRRGFVAGFFDAEGSNSTAIRIFNSDRMLVNFLEQSLQIFNFKYSKQSKKSINKLIYCITLKNGIKEKLRFFQLFNPVIKRKYSRLINLHKSKSIKIKNIIKTNKYIEMYDIQTSTGTYIAGGLLSHNCYNSNWKSLFSNYKVRLRKVSDVIKECDSLDCDLIFFADDYFGYDINWLHEFANNYKGKPYHCQLRLEGISKNRLDLLKRSGCYSVTVAVECANENIRMNVLNRKITDKKLFESMTMLKDSGIKIRTEQMLGIPKTTIEDDLFTLEWNVYFKPELAWTSIFQPYRGTLLGEYCVKKGYYDGNNDDIKETFFESTVLNFTLEHKKWIEKLQRIFHICSHLPEGHKIARKYLLSGNDFNSTVRGFLYEELFGV